MNVYGTSGRNRAKPGGTAEAKSFCPSDTETEAFLYIKTKLFLSQVEEIVRIKQFL